MTTGLFHIIAEHRPDAFRGVRQVLTGGSVTSPRLVQRVLEHCAGLRVTHAYGPTENTVFTTVHHFDGPHQVGHHLPIGTAIAGSGLAVLDHRGGLVPPGGVGELYNTGVGLADGYLGDPSRTAAAFVEDNVLGERAYRTGDLARWDGDGLLRFHGRVDRQVKIAGHRVEMVDVERRIAGQPGVLHALVFLSDDDRLCVAVRTDGADLAAIRAGAEAQLPAYARPQRWIETADFPVTRNGKIDTQALTTVSTVSVAVAPEAAPDMEEIVTQAWISVLGTDDFDSDEPFFEVGGDSLRLAQVRILLRERLSGRDVSMVDLYRYPTVQTLAQHLAGASQ
jgi:acyl-coenzyme A synthetase/AMP-(fatty) acid ligase/aryl carrier-like protein